MYVFRWIKWRLEIRIITLSEYRGILYIFHHCSSWRDTLNLYEVYSKGAAYLCNNVDNPVVSHEGTVRSSCWKSNLKWAYSGWEIPRWSLACWETNTKTHQRFWEINCDRPFFSLLHDVRVIRHPRQAEFIATMHADLCFFCVNHISNFTEPVLRWGW